MMPWSLHLKKMIRECISTIYGQSHRIFHAMTTRESLLWSGSQSASGRRNLQSWMATNAEITKLDSVDELAPKCNKSWRRTCANLRLKSTRQIQREFEDTANTMDFECSSWESGAPLIKERISTSNPVKGSCVTGIFCSF